MQFIKFLLAILTLISTAHSNEYDFKNYTVVDGLSESTINVIFEGDNGFLYIGTENGLGLFDGLTFFNYKMNVFNETTIFGNNIKSLCQDNYGDIWVGTELGVSKLNTKTRKFKRITNTKYNLKDIEKIFNDKIQDVYEPSTAAMTVGGPIKCHGIPKSYGYKKLGYQGKHSISINVGYTIIIIETCVEDSGSPVKTEISIE